MAGGPTGVVTDDLGTTGDKATLVSHAGEVLAACTSSYGTDFGPRGKAEQDPEAWWTALCAATRELLERSATAAADVEQGGTLTLPLSQLPSQWNYGQLDGALADASLIESAVLPQPFRIDEKGVAQIDENLVTSAEATSEDPLVVTYDINPDAVWSDGTPITVALGITPDVLYDLEINPNRPDAMSVAGVARDLAARLGLPFAIPEPQPEIVPGDARDALARVGHVQIGSTHRGDLVTCRAQPWDEVVREHPARARHEHPQGLT